MPSIFSPHLYFPVSFEVATLFNAVLVLIFHSLTKDTLELYKQLRMIRLSNVITLSVSRTIQLKLLCFNASLSWLHSKI